VHTGFLNSIFDEIVASLLYQFIRFRECTAFGLLNIWAKMQITPETTFNNQRKNRAIARRWFRLANNAFCRFARHRTLSVMSVGIAAFVVSAALSLCVRMPQPSVHDEFSYLLAADTFAHGRLTNPTHPMWFHFESMHIIHQPTYASKYPPGQGLMLAAGQVLTSYPIVGVWLSTALGCAAICWMLMGWMTPRWALLGGLFAVMHPLILEWSQNYWGGAVALTGGALILGAFRRIVRHPRTRDSVVMGIGMAILANSRPYEGLILSVILIAGLLWWMRSSERPSWRIVLKSIALPILIVLGITVGAMGYYNMRVTGNPLLMPYMVHEATYSVTPNFLWQKVKPEPFYQHKEIRDLHTDYELSFYRNQHSLSGFAVWSVVKILYLFISYFSLVGLLLPIVAIPFVIEKNRWMRFALLTTGLFIVALLPVTYFQLHYSAPMTGLIILLSVQAMRQMKLWRWRGLRTGRFLAGLSVLLCIASFVVFCTLHVRASHRDNNLGVQRARILDRLNHDEKRHLVIVQYSPEHNVHNEWVFNEADIDNAKVVWARDMEADGNRELIDYFKDRQVWLIKADEEPLELVPYPLQSGI
jgi:hypothetical protein